MDTTATPTTPPASLPGTGKKVLCVEDEHFISELYVRALTKAGYAVTVVIDGEDGLAAAMTDQYDVILLDIMLPSMTGLEVLKRLHDPKHGKQLRGKLIITTNLEQSEDNRAEVESQADGYIIKAEMTPRQVVEFVNQLN